MNRYVIETKQITKTYNPRSPFIALDHVDLHVSEGCIYGLTWPASPARPSPQHTAALAAAFPLRCPPGLPCGTQRLSQYHFRSPGNSGPCVGTYGAHKPLPAAGFS